MEVQEHSQSEANEKPNKYVALAILLIALGGIIYSFWDHNSQDVFMGTVKDVVSENEVIIPMGNTQKRITEQNLLVDVTISGENREVPVANDYMPVNEGDKVYVRGSAFGSDEWTLDNISRSRGLAILFGVFVLLVLLTSGIKGFYSLVGLLFSFGVIFTLMLPSILAGYSPIIVGIGSAALILIASLYLSYGINRKSIAAFIGIIIALAVVGFISNYFVDLLRFTGTNEASIYLDMSSGAAINLVGLFAAGIIIAAVGVLDDVAVIQSSIVFSLSAANKELRGAKLFREAMRVGKDHISAVVNTLVLAYTGASLPLLLLLSIQKTELGHFSSMEMIAEEIVRTLISSSGILLAVPLTTLISVLLVRAEKKATLDSGRRMI